MHAFMHADGGGPRQIGNDNVSAPRDYKFSFDLCPLAGRSFSAKSRFP